MTKAKWLVYMVLLGMTPVLTRLLVWTIATRGSPLRAFEATDFISFTLVLVVTNVSGLEHSRALDPSWKTWSNGISMFIAFLVVAVFVITCLPTTDPPMFDNRATFYATVVLALGATVQSYSVWDRLLAVRQLEERAE